MKKVKFSVSTNNYNSEISGIFTFEDLGITDITEENEIEEIINEAFRDWIFDNINSNLEFL